jgi:hypothetical protein
MTRIGVAFLLLLAPLAQAQLTEKQKVADLESLAAIYAKNYGPYDWKKAAFEFDLFDLRPWVERVKATKDDYEYFDVLMEYVASLRDGHTTMLVPSSFSANLGFTVDIYDGKVLIDSINRVYLPQDRFPCGIGDEVVSVDNVPVEDWIARLRRYYPAGNERTSRRSAASAIAVRSQSRIPWVNQTGETAEVVVRRETGELVAYTLKWQKSGNPIDFAGPVPDLVRGRGVRAVEETRGENDLLSPWQRPLEKLMEASVAREDRTALGVGAQAPGFALPDGFEVRLGRSASEVFYSGRYTAEGLRIGFIRIPSYSPAIAASQAIALFEREVLWMQENTDGLIIDDTRNPGGSVSYVEELCRRLIPQAFRSIGFEVRATLAFVDPFQQSVQQARQSNQPEWVIQGLEERAKLVLEAYRQNRGKTPPVSLTNPWMDLEPARASNGQLAAYTKPLMVLVDEFSSSGGDMFPATLADAKRALVFGYRTNGLGGSVVNWTDGLNYSEFGTRVTVTLMVRKENVKAPDLPEAPLVENIGVRPDVDYDAMTRENLLTQGRPFVGAFTQAMADHILKTRQ